MQTRQQETEEYVRYQHDRQGRSLLAQLRCGILPIKIETGRFSNIEPDKRLCELCEMKKVEDEIHFVCECPIYDVIRKTMYDCVSKTCDNFKDMGVALKFQFLLKSRWRDVSKFLKLAWNIRKNRLYN